MNLLLKFPKSRNLWIFLMFFGTGHFWIFRVFSGFILIPFFPTMKPRKSTLCLWNLYFSFSSSNLFGRSLLRIILTCYIYFFMVLEYISISSRYTTAKILRYFVKILLTIAWQNIEAFINSKDIIWYSKFLYLILKAVFYSLFFFICIKLYAPRKSSLVNHWVLFKRFWNSPMFGRRYLFLMVILFSFL